jgi:hypothetical protein
MPELYPDAAEGPYTVPSGDDVADGPKAFRDFADSMPVPKDNFTVVSKTADFTLTAGEEGALFAVAPNSGTIDVTVPTGMRSGYACVIAHVGGVATHDVALVAASGVTIQDVTLLRTKQYRMTSLVHLGGETWITCMGGIPPVEETS